MDNKNFLKIHSGKTELPNTIDECHKLIDDFIRIIPELFVRIEKLEIENRELRERLNSNSSNSSGNHPLK